MGFGSQGQAATAEPLILPFGAWSLHRDVLSNVCLCFEHGANSGSTENGEGLGQCKTGACIDGPSHQKEATPMGAVRDIFPVSASTASRTCTGTSAIGQPLSRTPLKLLLRSPFPKSESPAYGTGLVAPYEKPWVVASVANAISG
jgi:hypothetical protein